MCRIMLAAIEAFRTELEHGPLTGNAVCRFIGHNWEPRQNNIQRCARCGDKKWILND